MWRNLTDSYLVLSMHSLFDVVFRAAAAAQEDSLLQRLQPATSLSNRHHGGIMVASSQHVVGASRQGRNTEHTQRPPAGRPGWFPAPLPARRGCSQSRRPDRHPPRRSTTPRYVADVVDVSGRVAIVWRGRRRPVGWIQDDNIVIQSPSVGYGQSDAKYGGCYLALVV